LDRGYGHAVPHRACPLGTLSRNAGPPAATAVGSRTSGLAIRAPLAPPGELVVVGDHTRPPNGSMLCAKRCVITRVRLYAALCQPAPPWKPRQNGGPREKGARLPTLVPVADNLVTDWKGLRPPTGRYNGSYALTPMLIRRERFPTIGHSRNVAAGKLSSSAVCSAMCTRKLKAKTSNDWSYQIDCPLARWSHNPDREACPLRSGGSQVGRDRPFAQWPDLSYIALRSTSSLQYHRGRPDVYTPGGESAKQPLRSLRFRP
jgi:hypothetical protein